MVIMSLASQYLLLLACSQRKYTEPALLPALERYDGGNYRLLRKAQREGYFPNNLDVLILSAKYGLIMSTSCIPYYDQRMNQQQAATLKPQVMETLQTIGTQKAYKEIYVELGRDYMEAIDDLAKIFPEATIIYAQGRIGMRLANLKRWLMGIQQNSDENVIRRLNGSILR